ncbi:MAG: hypothetical protein MI919_41525 [Holophagales bacterium]|nr:hypothetical protein [Holophagales bacterium]
MKLWEYEAAMRDLHQRRIAHQVCIKSIEIEQVAGLLVTASEWRFVLAVFGEPRAPGYPVVRFSHFEIGLEDIGVRIDAPVEPGPQNLKIVDICSPPVEGLGSFHLSGTPHGPHDLAHGDLPALSAYLRQPVQTPASSTSGARQPFARLPIEVEWPENLGPWVAAALGGRRIYSEGQTYTVTVGDDHNRYSVTFCIRQAAKRWRAIEFAAAEGRRKITAQEALDFARHVGAEVKGSSSTELIVETLADLAPIEEQWRRA